MEFFCPPGTAYWGPMPFLSSCRTSWVGVMAVRLLQLFWIVGWLITLAVQLFVALFFSVGWPFFLWVWTLFLNFFNFYVGLLLLETNIEMGVFMPFLLLVSSGLWWLFWPEIGCVLEKAYPIFRGMVDYAGVLFSVAVMVFNLLVTMWNTLCPLLGYFIYVVLDLCVEVFRLMNQLFGEANISALQDACMSIAMQIAEFILNIMEAVVSITPSILQVAATVAGACVNIVLTIAPVLLQVFTYTFRIMPLNLGPITKLIVKVVQFVQKTFFLRMLLDVATVGGLATAGLADDAHTHEQLNLWRTFGESSSRYWTPDSARRSAEHLSDISEWLIQNPPEAYSTYYMYKGYQQMPPDASNSYYAGHMKKRGDADDDNNKDECSPYDAFFLSNCTRHYDDRSFSSHAHNRGHTLPYAHEVGPLSAHPFTDDVAASLLVGHERVQPDEDIERRLPCRSRFCKAGGGGDVGVEHPVKQLRAKHMQHQTLLSSSVKAQDKRHERKRHAHALGAIHTARHVLHHFSRKYVNGAEGATASEHMSRVWKQFTGHDSFHAAAEAFFSTYDHPMDNFAPYIPVLSEWFPFNAILLLHPHEERAQYFGQWAKKRRFFLAPVTDEYTGETHNVIHVGLEDAGEDSTYAQMMRAHMRAKRDAGADADAGLFSASINGTSAGTDTHVRDKRQLDPVSVGFVFVLAMQRFLIVAAAYQIGKLVSPALPLLEMLNKRDCFHEPRHPFCLPLIPIPLTCLIQRLLALIPRNLPVQLCNYEEQCADIGFCIPDRPSVKTGLLIIDALPFYVNWCWIKNIFVWLGVFLGLTLPALRLSLSTLGVLVPVFGRLVFRPLVTIIPSPISLQQFVCLIVFMYALALGYFFVFLFTFVWPLVLWVVSVFQSFMAMFAMLRGQELALQSAMQNEPWFQEVRERVDEMQRHNLDHDEVFAPLERLRHANDPSHFDLVVDPSRTALQPYRSQAMALSAGSGPGWSGLPQFDDETLPDSTRNQRALEYGAQSLMPAPPPQQQQDVEAQIQNHVGAGRTFMPRETQRHLRVLIASHDIGATIFGPPLPGVTATHIHDFHRRWHAFLPSAHFAAPHFIRSLNEYFHQKQKYMLRKPPEVERRRFRQ